MKNGDKVRILESYYTKRRGSAGKVGVIEDEANFSGYNWRVRLSDDEDDWDFFYNSELELIKEG